MKLYDTLCSKEDLQAQFLEYDSGYICDVITEIADSNVDIYTSDLMKSAHDLYMSGSYEDSQREFGGEATDLVKALQQAQYYYNSQLLYEDIDGMIADYIDYQTEQNSLGIIDSENLEELQDYVRMNCDNFDNNDMLENVIENVIELIDQYKEEEQTK